MESNRKFRIVTTLILALVAGFLGYVVSKAWYGSKNIFISGRNPVSQVVSLVFNSGKLVGEKDGQVNVLLLGVGGAGHDGPYLSDTIIIASVKIATSEVSLISIPRDTLISIPGFTGLYKINEAYAYATQKYGPKVGLAQARIAVSDLTGLDIPYAGVIDFEGFSNAVDHLGGIDVQIDNTFTDSFYPNDKFGYIAPVTFKAGVEHMDGERALIYARSRYSTSDFDRARRQQRIMEAFQARVRQLNVFKDMGTINRLFDEFTNNVSTNLDPGEVKKLADLTGTQTKIYSSVLDPTTGLVCSFLSEAKGYHLTLCPGRTQDDLYKYVETSFSRGRVAGERPVVQIQNATTVSGLAMAASDQLSLMGFKTSFGNTSKITDPSQTIIYDLTDGKKPDSLAVLLVNFGGTLSNNPPVIQAAASVADFMVVLGRNYKAPVLDIINLDPPKPEEDKEQTEDAETTPATPDTTKPKPKTSDGSEEAEPEPPVGGAAEEIPATIPEAEAGTQTQNNLN